MPGADDAAARSAAIFDSFLAEEAAGGTPRLLRQLNIYHQIAIPLKFGAWREVSMILMAKSLAATVDDAAQGSQLGDPFTSATNTSVTLGTISVRQRARRWCPRVWPVRAQVVVEIPLREMHGSGTSDALDTSIADPPEISTASPRRRRSSSSGRYERLDGPVS
jgi:hypothetical protein